MGRLKGDSKHIGRALSRPTSSKTTSVKNQIRSLHRLIKSEKTAKARVKAQQKIAELQSLLLEHKQVARERQLAVRYHKVRFFERVKLERRIKQLRTSVRNADEARKAKLERELLVLEADLEYVKFFPRGYKYVSVIKQAETAEGQAQLDAQRSALRQLVKQHLADAALVSEVNEGGPLNQVYDSKAGQFDQFLGEATPARASASTSQAKLMAQPSLRYAAARRSSHQGPPKNCAQQGTSDKRTAGAVQPLPLATGAVSTAQGWTTRKAGSAKPLSRRPKPSPMSKSLSPCHSLHAQRSVHKATRPHMCHQGDRSGGPLHPQQPPRTRAEGGRKRRQKG